MTDSTAPIIQLMRPGATGDLLMATALLPGLKAQGYRVRFICHPNYSQVLEGHPLIDEFIIMRTAHREKVLEATAHLETPEKAVYLPYPFYAKRDLPEHPITQHITHFWCDLVGIPKSDELSLHLDDSLLEWAAPYENDVLIHTHTLWSPYKNWPLERWAQLARHIKEEFGLRVWQLGAPKDPPVDGVPRLETPDVRHAIAALKGCRLFIGLDSVFNHASRAVHKPSIILWGSTHPQGHGYAQNVNLINNVVWQPEMGTYGPALTCQPCYREYSGPGNNNNQRACPYTVPYPRQALPEKMHPNPELNACMYNQSLETVLHHARGMLAGKPVEKPITDRVRVQYA